MVDTVVTPQADPDNPTVVIDTDATKQQATETIPLSQEHGEDDGSTVENVEREAREAGWVPEDQWKGDPRKWRDASTYVEARNHIMPIVQKENKSLRAQNQELASRLARLEQLEQQREIQREQLSVDTLKMQRRQAMEENDLERVTEIDSKLMDAAISQHTRPAPQQQNNQEGNRIYQEFIADGNDWAKDPKMDQVLKEQLITMAQAGTPLRGREVLEEAKDRVKRLYPERFGRTNRAPMSESGGFNGSSSRGNVRSWSDLKPEVQEAWEKHMLPEKGMTKEKLLRQAAENPTQYFRR